MSLRRLREQHVLTQGELAKEVRVSGSIIGKWERGESMPTPRNIRKLAAFFGLEPGEMRRILEADRKKPDVDLGPACPLDRFRKASRVQAGTAKPSLPARILPQNARLAACQETPDRAAGT